MNPEEVEERRALWRRLIRSQLDLKKAQKRADDANYRQRHREEIRKRGRDNEYRARSNPALYSRKVYQALRYHIRRGARQVNIELLKIEMEDTLLPVLERGSHTWLTRIDGKRSIKHTLDYDDSGNVTWSFKLGGVLVLRKDCPHLAGSLETRIVVSCNSSEKFGGTFEQLDSYFRYLLQIASCT